LLTPKAVKVAKIGDKGAPQKLGIFCDFFPIFGFIPTPSPKTMKMPTPTQGKKHTYI